MSTGSLLSFRPYDQLNVNVFFSYKFQVSKDVAIRCHSSNIRTGRLLKSS